MGKNKEFKWKNDENGAFANGKGTKSWKEQGWRRGWGMKKQNRRIKKYYVRVPTPHDQRNHCVLQMCTTGKKLVVFCRNL